MSEFISYFGQADQAVEEQDEADKNHLFEAEIWPDWVLEEKALPQAQKVLGGMQKYLEATYNMTAL